MIVGNYRQTADSKSQTVKETVKQNNHSDKGEREFLTPRKTVKMRPLNNIPQFASPDRFDPLRMKTDRTCTYQGVRNVCFSEILACFAFLKHPF